MADVAGLIIAISTFISVVVANYVIIRNLRTKNGLTVGQMVQHDYSIQAQRVPVESRTEEQRVAIAMLTPEEHQTHADQKLDK